MIGDPARSDIDSIRDEGLRELARSIANRAATLHWTLFAAFRFGVDDLVFFDRSLDPLLAEFLRGSAIFCFPAIVGPGSAGRIGDFSRARDFLLGILIERALDRAEALGGCGAISLVRSAPGGYEYATFGFLPAHVFEHWLRCVRVAAAKWTLLDERRDQPRPGKLTIVN